MEKEIQPGVLRNALSGEEVKNKDNPGGGSKLWEKLDNALTAAVFNNHSERLRIKIGLLKRMAQYYQRQGYAECVDNKYPPLRGLAAY